MTQVCFDLSVDQACIVRTNHLQVTLTYATTQLQSNSKKKSSSSTLHTKPIISYHNYCLKILSRSVGPFERSTLLQSSKSSWSVLNKFIDYPKIPTYVTNCIVENLVPRQPAAEELIEFIVDDLVSYFISLLKIPLKKEEQKM